ncbi:MAG: hypothetical protein RQ751_13445, partial [Longimicrobiales bacterium]|nr:hypothetical protein [Longimicrobiales bacterium]
ARTRLRSLLVPGLASLAVLVVLDPLRWLGPGVPALTDLPGHLLPIHILAEDLLPRGRIQGWSFDWFAGFPVYRYYFPLPGILTALLGEVVGLPLALRAMVGAPLVLLPWALWLFARAAGLDGPRTAGLVVVGASSVLMASHRIMGGNIASVVAGEFSYAWALLFLVLHLGLLGAESRSRRTAVWAGVALAAAVLSHVVPVMVAALGTAPLLLTRRLRGRILAAWALTGLLTAAWFLPMALSLDQVGSPRWAFAPGWNDLLPTELVLILPAALYGMWAFRRRAAAVALAAAAGGALVLAMVPQELVMRARPLPVWYLAVHMLAGAGTMHALSGAWPLRSGRTPVRVLGGLVAAGLWLVVVGVRGVDREHWAGVMDGLDARPGAAARAAVVARLQELPPGRVHWEEGPGLVHYGGTHGLGLIPYWTHHSTLSGLLRESAPLSEFLPVLDTELGEPGATFEYARQVPRATHDPAGAVPRLRMLGVRYLITHTDTAATLVAEVAGPPRVEAAGLRLFDLGPAALVEPLPCWRAPEADAPFREQAIAWFQAWEPGAPPLVDVSDGALPDPACDRVALNGDAARAGAGPDPSGAGPAGSAGPAAAAVAAEIEGDRIRITGARVGVPHLLRASYHTDWRAEGARGPYPASPWFMVVVPERPEVVLTFRAPPAQWVGRVLTAAGLILLGGLAVAGRRARGRRAG